MPHNDRPHAPPRPRRGQIWAGNASVNLSLLRTARNFSAAPLSRTMQSVLTRLEDNQEDLPERPCIVLRVHNAEGIAQVLLITCFSGQPVEELPSSFSDFAIAFGETRPWPLSSSPVFRPSPCVWSRSLEKPNYVFAQVYDVPIDNLTHRYTDKGVYSSLDERSLMRLEDLCNDLMAGVQRKSEAEVRQAIDEYEVSCSPSTCTPLPHAVG